MEVREASASYDGLTVLQADGMPGYKRTEVGVVPTDWLVVQAGELQPFVTSGSRGWAVFYSDTGAPFIRITNLGRDCIYPDLQDLRFVKLDESAREGIRTQLQTGDVLISITADIGIVGYVSAAVPKPAYINQHIALMRFDSSRICAKYVSYFWAAENSQRVFRAMTDSGAKAGMNLTTVKQILLAAPPTKAEQEAIAEALSDADALIESLQQLIAKKRRIKQGTMQTLLTGKQRLPGFTGQWIVQPLGDLASIQRGASPRPIDSPIWFEDDSPVGWVRISDLTQANIYLHETAQRLSALGVKHSRPVIRGSLIMSICATVGRPAITAIDACIHDGFVVFDSLRIDQKFLYYVLKFIEDDWSKHGQTGSQMNLNTGLINRTKVCCPPLDEQTAIATILTDMDTELAELETRLAKTRQLKQGMMQELLTGRIRLV